MPAFFLVLVVGIDVFLFCFRMNEFQEVRFLREERVNWDSKMRGKKKERSILLLAGRKVG